MSDQLNDDPTEDASEVADSEVAESEVAGSEVAGSEVAGSEVAESEAAESDNDAVDEDVAAKARPSQRLEQQTLWVDAQIKQAIARGEFDNLPGAGKPIEGLGGTHDPDWWVKKLIEREQISGLGPPAIMLRKEDAELDTRLDRVAAEAEVRRLVTDFNSRVVDARRQLLGGPPVVTQTRDVDAEVDAWKARREERRRALRGANQTPPAGPAPSESPAQRAPRRRLWRRRRRAGGQPDLRPE